MKLTLERIEEKQRNVERAAKAAGEPIEHWVKTAELLALLDSARALARLEDFDGLATLVFTSKESVTKQLNWGGESGEKQPGLAEWIHAALDEAEARK